MPALPKDQECRECIGIDFQEARNVTHRGGWRSTVTPLDVYPRFRRFGEAKTDNVPKRREPEVGPSLMACICGSQTVALAGYAHVPDYLSIKVAESKYVLEVFVFPRSRWSPGLGRAGVA